MAFVCKSQVFFSLVFTLFVSEWDQVLTRTFLKQNVLQMMLTHLPGVPLHMACLALRPITTHAVCTFVHHLKLRAHVTRVRVCPPSLLLGDF